MEWAFTTCQVTGATVALDGDAASGSTTDCLDLNVHARERGVCALGDADCFELRLATRTSQ